ncbi:MAG: lactonase family protein [Candidatus Pedobacter colombiensis]|uniref:Lactonase family protein n=1 Tax=Candidatus Pedobacter colombiensis TaxID=3121371 RepID=A0AAJ6B6C0_9SPHI|nr:lactonase family protein [Pedobacter sp.]WEK19787.1 MAG: lactonase family protein [Pedobacter sp.]
MKKILSLLLLTLFTLQSFAQKKEYNLIIGTYTSPGKSEGIYIYNFDANTAEFKFKSVAKDVTNPSYLAVSKNNKFIYSVAVAPDNNAAAAFGFDGVKGELTFINKQATGSPGPCFVLADEKSVFTANYGGGSISVFGIEGNGALTPLKQLIQHTGKSIDPQKRQESAHVHQIQFTPDRKYVTCTDLGEDQIYIYNYNPTAKEEVLSIKQVVKTTPGSGPRHLTFSPNGKFAYLAHEFNGIITVFAYNDGSLIKIQDAGTIDKDFSGRVDAADIHVSPDGKFLYETNRGDANTISAFAVQPNGQLNFVSRISTLGKGPRNFSIDPTGKYLLVGHQYTNDIVIFERNKKTGTLKDTGKRIELGAPVCLVFAPIK